jgi:hypothetical protein
MQISLAEILYLNMPPNDKKYSSIYLGCPISG